MIAAFVSVVALLAAGALAECPGSCSGHGLCGQKDMCACDANYFGADCSQRGCPYDYAFVDTPTGDLNHDGVIGVSTYVNINGQSEYEMFPTNAATGGFAAQTDEAHFYAECSGKGSCDRTLGECVCYAGFTGAACQRSTCPNDCSGQGICRTLREVAAGALSRQAVGSRGGSLLFAGVREPFDYSLWDADKHQMCVCDAGFSGIDCSQRSCPRSNDPLTPVTARWCGGQPCSHEVQSFRLSSAGDTTFRFQFTDTRNNTLTAYATVNTLANSPGVVPAAQAATFIAGPASNAGLIMSALRTIPGGAMQQVEVSAVNDVLDNGSLQRTFQVTYIGFSGAQYPMVISVASGAGTVEVAARTVVVGNFEDVECSGRGLCDSTAGLCKCFSGYYGVACEYQNALATSAAGAAAAAAAR